MLEDLGIEIKVVPGLDRAYLVQRNDTHAIFTEIGGTMAHEHGVREIKNPSNVMGEDYTGPSPFYNHPKVKELIDKIIRDTSFLNFPPNPIMPLGGWEPLTQADVDATRTHSTGRIKIPYPKTFTPNRKLPEHPKHRLAAVEWELNQAVTAMENKGAAIEDLRHERDRLLEERDQNQKAQENQAMQIRNARELERRLRSDNTAAWDEVMRLSANLNRSERNRKTLRREVEALEEGQRKQREEIKQMGRRGWTDPKEVEILRTENDRLYNLAAERGHKLNRIAEQAAGG